MAKTFVAFRFSKDIINYYEQVASNLNISKTKAIEDMINYYRDNKGFTLEMQQKNINAIHDVYMRVVPLVFGWATVIMLFRQNWFFILYAIGTLFPFLFPIKKTDRGVALA